MGRPGTAVARLAPPKVKKKQVAEIEVKPEKVTLSYSKILLFNVLFNVEILNVYRNLLYLYLYLESLELPLNFLSFSIKIKFYTF